MSHSAGDYADDTGSRDDVNEGVLRNVAPSVKSSIHWVKLLSKGAVMVSLRDE